MIEEKKRSDEEEAILGGYKLDPPGFKLIGCRFPRLDLYSGSHRLGSRYTVPFENRIRPPDGYEQGLGYVFSRCSTVARYCDMGSFEGGRLDWRIDAA